MMDEISDESFKPEEEGDYDTDFANKRVKIIEDTPDKTVKKVYYQKNDGGNGWLKIIETEKRIATICEVQGYDEQGRAQLEVEELGMDYEEICEYFPASGNSNTDYCLAHLLRSIIWEAYTEEENVDPGNVRHFWYTHLKYTIRNELGLGESASVKGAINDAWRDLINSGMISYEEMNVTSAKENVRNSFVADSPFSNIIVATEKEDLYEQYEWIPELFNCTLITAGGQPSRAVAEHFIKELKANGVDLDQQFYMCAISDFDPAGYFIQKAFRDQFELQMKKYGGTGSIEIIRLFINPDQVSDQLVEWQGVDYGDSGATKQSAKKAEYTKWEEFCKFTGGGLYEVLENVSPITEMEGERKEIKCPDCGSHMMYNYEYYYCDTCDTVHNPKILELDAFGKDMMEETILDELLEIIHKTSDESMIMIPEIMRVFDEMRKEVIEEMFERHKNDWLEPIIKEYIEEIDSARWSLKRIFWKEKDEEKDRYEEEIEPIQGKYEKRKNQVSQRYNQKIDNQYDEIDEEIEESGVKQELQEIEEKMDELERRRKELEKEIQDDFEDEFDEVKDWCQECQDERTQLTLDEEKEIKPHKEEHEENIEKIRKKNEFRMKQIDQFEEEKRALFNPIEYNLKEEIQQTLSTSNIDVWYADLEEDERTKKHIANLMTKPNKLLEQNISAWDQKHIPTFEEDDLLTKASKSRDRTVERHRSGFVPNFLDGMKEIIWEIGEQYEIEYPEVPEMEDFDEELEEFVEEIKEEAEEEVE